MEITVLIIVCGLVAFAGTNPLEHKKETKVEHYLAESNEELAFPLTIERSYRPFRQEHLDQEEIAYLGKSIQGIDLKSPEFVEKLEKMIMKLRKISEFLPSFIRNPLVAILDKVQKILDVIRNVCDTSNVCEFNK